MLGRRLLVLFAVLLGLTALVTSLAPRPTIHRRSLGAGVATPTATPSPTPVRHETRTLSKTISADAGRPRAHVRAHVGDVLELTVAGDELDAVEIPGLGKLASVEPGAPAHFEILLDARGNFRVKLLDAQRTVGLIEVAATPEP